MLITFQAATSPNVTAERAALSCPSNMISASPQESNVPPPIFSFGDKIVSRKEPNGVSTMVDFNSKTEDKAPMLFTSTTSSTVVSGSSGPKFDDSAVAEPENSNREYLLEKMAKLLCCFCCPSWKKEVAAEKVKGSKDLLQRDFGFAAESAKKEAELDKAEHRNTLKASFSFRSSETVPSSVSNSSAAANIFSFGGPASCSSLINGTLVSAAFLFSAVVPPLGASDLTVQSSSIPVSASSRITSGDHAFSSITGMTAGSTSSISGLASPPAFAATPVFNFGSTVVSDPAPTGIESAKSKNRRTNPADVNGALFVGSSSAITSTGNAFSGGKSPTAGAVSSIYGGTSSSKTTNTGCSSFIASSSVVRSTGSGTFSFNVGATASAHANQSQRTNPFSNGSAETSASGTGSSTQSMPTLFGLSASSPSFGFGFGLSAANNNDQMNMEDSMAEDTVQASTTPTGPVFNQPASTPSSELFFGATSPSGLGQFGSPLPSVAKPFQFGGQPNLSAPQNPSLFQASGSLEFNGAGAGAGSFSLGIAGGDKSGRKIVRVKDQASTPPTVPVFNQPASTPSSGFFFGVTTPSRLGQFGSPSPLVANPFPFGGQPNLSAPQNPSLSQTSSLEFNGAGAGAGSLSLGTGGGDKFGRAIVRIEKGQRKR